jgi:hypothetical protein
LTVEWDHKQLFVTDEAGQPITLQWGKETWSWLDPRTGRQWRGSHISLDGREEHFGVELWLRCVCCGGNLLWARNQAHLDYIAAFVAGELREQEAGEAFRPLSYKLPKWMKSRKHRDEILVVIGRLRSSLAD